MILFFSGNNKSTIEQKINFCYSDSRVLSLLCCLHNCLHTLETVFPSTNLLLNRFPFFKLNLTEHVALDDDKAIELVYLGVDNFVLNSFDGPHFDVVDRDLQYREKTRGVRTVIEQNILVK